MRVLLVEDDLPLANALSESLRRVNYLVDLVHTGREAGLALAAEQNDVVVLDLGLPDMDGLEVLTSLRKKWPTLPVIILTARDSANDKVIGLDKGADDYLPKPFAMEELLARLRVIERRLSTSSSTLITLGTVSLDLKFAQAQVKGEALTLSRREYMLLRSLMENAGRIQSKQQLETKLYEWGEEVVSNTIEVHIHHLRKKLPEGFIRTIRGVGYTISKTGE